MTCRRTPGEQQGVSALADEPIIHIAQLEALAYRPKHRRAAQAKVVSNEAFNVSVYLLAPLGGIPPHSHSQSWDVAVVLEGNLRIRALTPDGLQVFTCGPGAIHISAPGVAHEVENASASDDARFLLIQGPSQGFDFLPAAAVFAAETDRSETS
jgi:quercetin dioxygenase-like cupin family protein